jgi:2-polyprenyl-6-methoxyphenol hydroxylase-like FAD-dependent oxidoreductase
VTASGSPVAVVVGGGIGGLAAARGLGLAGWSVQVLEAADALEPLGAGISLWPNAVRALADLGVELPPSTAGSARAGGILTSDGRLLSRTDPEHFPERYGAPLVAIHRARLQEALLGSLPPGTVQTGARVTDVAEAADSVLVRHSLGEHSADLVVLADGVHSRTRRLVAGDRPRPVYAGYTAWRAVTGPGVDLHGSVGATESWGRGERFGVVPLADGRTYWFATANTAEGGRSAEGEHAEVLRRFSGWHDPVPGVLRATDPDAVLRHDVYELRPHPRSYARGRMVLLGDAAHAMSPNLGQGACQAIEDAATLRVLLPPDGDLSSGLARYDSVRRRRARSVVGRSAQLGRIGQLEGRLTTALRDAVLRAVPDGLTARQLDGVLGWRPPAPDLLQPSG